jgi:WD40 repeat protein
MRMIRNNLPAGSRPRATHPARELGYVLACFCLLSGDLAGREWRDSSGAFSVQAELVTVKEGQAFLKLKDERVVKIPLSKLSRKDQDYLATLPEFREEVEAMLKLASPFKDTPAASSLPSSSPNASASPSASAPGGSRRNERSGNTAAANAPLSVRSVRSIKSKGWGFNSIALTPDARFLAAAYASQSLQMFDIETGRLASETPFPDGLIQINGLQFTSAGQHLVGYDTSGHVVLWKFTAGEPLVQQQVLRLHRGPVTALSISSDVQYGLSGDQLGQVRYWSLESGEILHGWDGFSGRVQACFLNQSGSQGLAMDGRSIALLDLKSGEILQTLKLDSRGGQFSSFSPDGTRVAVEDGRNVHFSNILTGDKLPVQPVGEIQWAGAFSPDGKVVLTGGNSKLSLWNALSPQRILELPLAESGYVKSVAFSQDGQHFAVTCAPIGNVVAVFQLTPDN